MKNTKKLLNRKPEIVISLDIHAANIFLYALNTYTGEILDEGNIFGGYKAVLKRIKKFASPKNSIILLEAGNQGFSPYRPKNTANLKWHPFCQFFDTFPV